LLIVTPEVVKLYNKFNEKHFTLAGFMVVKILGKDGA